MNEALITTRSSQTIGEIAAALCKAQQAMGKIHKDKDNDYFKSKYADLAQVIEVVLPALNKQDIAVIQGGAFIEGQAFVTCLFAHGDSGEWIEGLLPMPVKDKTNPQAMGSTTTYGRRYLLAAMACVAADDDDGNAGARPEPKKAEPKKAAPKKAEEPGWKQVCEDNPELKEIVKLHQLTKGDLNLKWELAKGDADAFTKDLVGLDELPL